MRLGLIPLQVKVLEILKIGREIKLPLGKGMSGVQEIQIFQKHQFMKEGHIVMNSGKVF